MVSLKIMQQNTFEIFIINARHKLMLKDLSINHRTVIDDQRTNMGQFNVAFKRLLSATPNLVSFCSFMYTKYNVVTPILFDLLV